MRKIITAWFRDPRVWRALEPVVPYRARIWCGAVGSGEEAWTAAMVARSHAGTVLGTDVDPDLIDIAKKGIYPAMPVRRDVPTQWASQFHPAGPDHLAVPDHLRPAVTLDVLDLDTDPVPPCDIAILRNVWRHLAPQSVERLAGELADVLPENGRLVIGGDRHDVPAAELDAMPPREHIRALATLYLQAEETALLDPVRELFVQAEGPFILKPRKARR